VIWEREELEEKKQAGEGKKKAAGSADARTRSPRRGKQHHVESVHRAGRRAGPRPRGAASPCFQLDLPAGASFRFQTPGEAGASRYHAPGTANGMAGILALENAVQGLRVPAA